MISIENELDLIKIIPRVGEANYFNLVANKDITIPNIDNYVFDSGIKLSLSHKNDLVFIEGNALDKTGCYIEDLLIAAEDDLNVKLIIKNYTQQPILIEKNRTIGILYKFINYSEKITDDIITIHSVGDFIVGYKNNTSTEYILNAFEVSKNNEENEFILNLKVKENLK